jgi:hypothetical protein
MVDQAEVTPANGRTELPPQAVARGTAGFLHDVATLAELQGKLFTVDLQQGVSKLVTPIVVMVLGIVVALGCVPIALMTLAHAIDELTPLTLWPSYLISLIVGLLMSALLALPAYARLKSGINIFDRSLAECRRNTQWAKDTLKRLGSQPSPPINQRRW